MDISSTLKLPAILSPEMAYINGRSGLAANESIWPTPGLNSCTNLISVSFTFQILHNLSEEEVTKQPLQDELQKKNLVKISLKLK